MAKTTRTMGRSLAAAGAACLLVAGVTFAHVSVGDNATDPTAVWDETDRGEIADANVDTETPDASEAPEASDAPESSDAPEASDAPEPSEKPEATPAAHQGE